MNVKNNRNAVSERNIAVSSNLHKRIKDRVKFLNRINDVRTNIKTFVCMHLSKALDDEQALSAGKGEE